MDPKDLPNVTAFQDEFTREFMTSTDEVSDGYYLFESKTGGYTIPFPEDAHIDQIHYEKVKESSEWTRYNADRETITGEPYTVYLIYENSQKPIDPEIKLKHFRTSVKYDGEFDKKEHDDLTHYFTQTKYVLSDKESSVYRFFGLIHANDTNQTVRYEYHIPCEDEQKGCDYDLEAIEQQIEKVMTSIEFSD